MAVILKTLVGLARHVAIVSGLNRYLDDSQTALGGQPWSESYAAATAVSLALEFLRVDLNNRVEVDCPD